MSVRLIDFPEKALPVDADILYLGNSADSGRESQTTKAQLLEVTLKKAANLSDLVSASTARTNLGLEIGVNVQAYDPALLSIAGLTTSANQMIYATASDTYATASLTVFARTILDDADAATARTTLGSAASGANSDITSLTGLTTPLSLSRGGSNANLTASNGGIFYSTATAGAILSGTATANLPLLSGSTAAPAWGSFALSLGGAVTTGGAFTLSGAYPFTGTLTASTSVTFPTSGTLATTAQIPVALAWAHVTSDIQAMVTKTGYYAENNSTRIAFTAPASPDDGDPIAIMGYGTAGWVMYMSTGQKAQIGINTCATSTGSVSSDHYSNSVVFTWNATKSTWMIFGAPQGQPNMDVI